MDRIPFTIYFTGYPLSGWFKALQAGDPPRVFHVAINDSFVGTLRHDGDWTMDGVMGRDLAPVLGAYIMAWYQ